ncbi:MAG: hypothetical protein ACRBCL_14235 [Maritimibacter sp.]
MKKIALGLALTLVATAATAGALSDPIIEQDIIVQTAANSSIDHSVLPPLIFLIFAGLAIAFF